MAKYSSKQTQLKTTNFIPSLLILLFLLVGFIPNWEAVDKIAPQWLYLSLINLICGIFLFINRRNFLDSILSVLSSYKVYLTFLLLYGHLYHISMQLIQQRF